MDRAAEYVKKGKAERTGHVPVTRSIGEVASSSLITLSRSRK
jgi:hypothetical protein